MRVFVHTPPSSLRLGGRPDNYFRVFRRKDSQHIVLFESQNTHEVKWAVETARRIQTDLGGVLCDAWICLWKPYPEHPRFPIIADPDSKGPEPFKLAVPDYSEN